MVERDEALSKGRDVIRTILGPILVALSATLIRDADGLPVGIVALCSTDRGTLMIQETLRSKAGTMLLVASMGVAWPDAAVDASSSDSQASSDSLLTWGEGHRFPSEETVLGIPVSTDMTSDGGLVVADMGTQEVIQYQSDGSVGWRVGGKGDGPGEFNLVYRVSVAPNQDVLALDLQRHDVSRFDPHGEFLERIRLPFRFSQVDGMVALEDGGLAISGVSRWSPRPFQSSIHVFDSDLEHVRSFGPVPDIEEEWILERWGAGGLTRSSDGALVFTLRLPFRIQKYDTDGSLLREVRVDLTSEYTPGDVFLREVEGRRTTYTVADVPILRPHRTVLAGDGVWIISWSRGSSRKVAVVDRDGRIHPAREMPATWRSITHFDAERQALWVKGEESLEPTILRYNAYLTSNGGDR